MTTEESCIAIECVALTQGKQGLPDSVPDMVMNDATNVPVDQIVLRYTNAISQKVQQYKNWCESGVIGKDDPFIITIAANPTDFVWSDTHPLVFKALVPMGPLVLTLDRKTGKKLDSHHQFRDSIIKENKSEVTTLYFANDSYSQISAVVAARFDIGNNPMLNQPTEYANPFLGFCYIENPFAASPIEASLFRDSEKYAITRDNLTITMMQK